MEDTWTHFLPLQPPWTLNGQMWSIFRMVSEVQYRMYYILGTDCHLFKNVYVWDPMHNSNHYLILRYLRGATLR